MDDFDAITCEEFYAEDEERRTWMDELERDYVNFELQEIAEEQRAGQVIVELDALALYFGA